jgi:hypothetical protein
MTAKDLEARIAALEKRVAELESKQVNGSNQKDWRQSLGLLGDDPTSLEIIEEGRKWREKEREKARRLADRADKKKMARKAAKT